MNIRLLLSLVTLVLSIPCPGADLPSISSLKVGEKVYVSMRLYGYTLTGADFLFTHDMATIKPLNKNPGELVLTKEEKEKLDEYLVMVRNGAKRPPDQEGFEYSIKLFRNEQQVGTWSFKIHDAQGSKKPYLSLYELKDRIEKQQKTVEQAAPSGGDKPLK